MHKNVDMKVPVLNSVYEQEHEQAMTHGMREIEAHSQTAQQPSTQKEDGRNMAKSSFGWSQMTSPRLQTTWQKWFINHHCVGRMAILVAGVINDLLTTSHMGNLCMGNRRTRYEQDFRKFINKDTFSGTKATSRAHPIPKPESLFYNLLVTGITMIEM